MNIRAKMQRSFVLAASLLFAASTAAAQEFPKIETAPGYMYTHTGDLFGTSKAINCSGIGGTMAVNMTSVFGIAADLGTCFPHGMNDAFNNGVGSKVSFSEQTYLFGPRLTFNRKGKIHPFTELNFGAVRVKAKCDTGNLGNACGSLTASQLPTGTVVVVTNPTANSASKVAFGMTVGGGFDVQLNKKFALRLVQAEYLYTRFGNDCQFAICSNNNSQNSFRLKSGVVMSWGGAN
jgi:opacity protein-like surface antigen